MSFRPIEQRIAANAPKPASIRLVERAGKSRPACIVSFRAVFAAQLKWKAGEDVAVQLGEGDDAGKLRLVRGEKPAIVAVRSMKKGGMTFDLGHIPGLNHGEASDKIEIDARAIDKNTVEVTLPDWDAEGVESEEFPAKEPSVRPAPRPPAGPAKPAPGKKAGEAERPVTHNGVTVHFSPNNEAVTHGGKQTEVSARQAQFIALLARVMPQPVGRDFIKQKLNIAGHLADATLDTMAMDLAKGLPGIGLTIRNTKGIGFALQVKE